MDSEHTVHSNEADTAQPARFGIAEKVSLLFVAATAMLGIVLGTFFAIRHINHMKAAFDNRLGIVVEALATHLRRPVALDDRAGIAAAVDAALDNNRAKHCLVLDPSGRVLYQAGLLPQKHVQIYSAAISVQRGLDEALGDSDNAPTADGAMEIVGEVRLGATLLDLRSRIAETVGLTALFVFVMVAAASIIGYIALHRLLGEPVRMLVGATNRLAHGDLDAMAPIERSDEIGLLATALNAMVADLRNTVVSRDYVDSIIDSMIDALFVVNREGIITRTNLAAESLLGWQTAELNGKPLAKFFASGPPSSEAGSFSAVLEHNARLRNVETILRGKTADTRVLFSSSGMVDADGNVQAAVCVAVDVSDLKRAEEELRKLSSAVEQSTGGIALADLEHYLTYANNAYAAMHSYSNSELLGRQLRDMHPPEQHDLLDEALAEVEASGSWSGEMQSMTSDGASFPTYVSVTTLRDEAGFPIAILVHVNDITRQKELEVQLMQAQKLDSIGQLAGGIAHDFNNMLGAISGYADMIRQRFGTADANLDKYAGRILEASRRSADLTAKLLAFARRGTFEMAMVDVHATVQDVFAILEHTIDRRISIVKRLDAPAATVLGDRTQLQNAILNLAVNARDAMQDEGTMTFATSLVDVEDVPWHGTRPARSPKRFIRLSVSDTGIGMDEQTVSRIFEPFFTTKQLGKGTGLGLASVYGTLEAHHGLIDVQSKPGAGSTFSIFLPLKMEEVKVAEDGTQEVRTGTGTILVVDDEQLVRDMASDMLTSVGYSVVTCGDGTEAVAYYGKHAEAIDVVILDMIMPKLGGFDCYMRLKSISPDVRVVVSSGYSVNDEVRRLLSAGALGFVQKPYDTTALAKAVADSLAETKA